MTISRSSSEGLSRKRPWMVRQVTSTSAPSGGMNRKRRPILMIETELDSWIFHKRVALLRFFEPFGVPD